MIYILLVLLSFASLSLDASDRYKRKQRSTVCYDNSDDETLAVSDNESTFERQVLRRRLFENTILACNFGRSSPIGSANESAASSPPPHISQRELDEAEQREELKDQLEASPLLELINIPNGEEHPPLLPIWGRLPHSPLASPTTMNEDMEAAFFEQLHALRETLDDAYEQPLVNGSPHTPPCEPPSSPHTP